MPTRSRRALLGGLPVEEVYVYPPALGVRAAPPEQRRLKKDVEQIGRPQDVLLTALHMPIRPARMKCALLPLHVLQAGIATYLS